MQIINNKTVKVFDETELKQVLENTNDYQYIYFGNSITLTSGININENKEKIIIDGNTYTLTGVNSTEQTDTFIAHKNNKEIEMKNMTINYTNTSSVIYIPEDKSYNIVTTYNKINFTGTKLSFNPYGSTKIIDSNITITTNNNIAGQEVCTTTRLIIGGNTTITNETTNYSLFNFKNNASPSVIFLCKSNIILTIEKKDFMTGTNKLNFTILHDTVVELITGNGFSNNPVYGTNNVLIEERATFNFIEKNHHRVPMWSVFGSITMKEDSSLEIINTYEQTPDDNYNIFFKGSNQNITLENPNKVVMYSKNANVIHTTNNVTFNIKAKRINMWPSSTTFTNAGDINNIPDFSWYKENDLFELNGTTITSNNLTEEEILNLPDLSNFNLKANKQFSIGNINSNIHQINSTKNTISGHTVGNADILIKYNSTNEIITAQSDGLFEYQLQTPINDNTEVQITINIPNSFIYETRKIITPYNGELSILNKIPIIEFELTPISNNQIILPKKEEFKIEVIDSRETKTNWKLYAHITQHLTSQNGFILENALIFKKTNNEIIVLDDNPSLIYQEENNQATKKVVTWSKEKGPLIDITNNGLEINEEYFSYIYIKLEE